MVQSSFDFQLHILSNILILGRKNMATVYLSPSVQESNKFLYPENEEYYMNLIADNLEPYLEKSGINFTRNSTKESLTDIIEESNQGNYDLHVAIHSNAAPADISGQLKGTHIYYNPNDIRGRRLAQILSANFKDIYPNPQLVRTVPTTTLREITMSYSPSVIIETGYHDNEEDVEWIINNIDDIANAINLSLNEYFGITGVSSKDSNTFANNTCTCSSQKEFVWI